MPTELLNGFKEETNMGVNLKKNNTIRQKSSQINDNSVIEKHNSINGNNIETINDEPTNGEAIDIHALTHEELAAIENKKRKHQTYDENYSTDGLLPSEIGTDYNFPRKIVWFNTIGFLALHLMAVYGYFLCFTSAKWPTVVWMFTAAFVSGEGVTIGAHRLYSHKSFKATFPLRLALIIFQTVAGQNCMYIWVRDHRQHHKYSDTDADPHNAKRGFFFSHMGWLMSRKHPAVKSKGKTIDMSDLEADQLVMFQKKFYKPLYALFAIAIPVLIPVYFWHETYWNSLFISYFARYIMLLHITWLVNSAAHLYGTRPYDKKLQPVESIFVGYVAVGEGWHNYHHAFPWDYRAAEFGIRYSPTTFIIDVLAALGLAYDLKVTPESMVEKRTRRLGDGTHPHWGTDDNRNYSSSLAQRYRNVDNTSGKYIATTSEEGDECSTLKKRTVSVNG